MLRLSFKDGKERISDPLSCFKVVEDTRTLKISPKYIQNIGAGIREQLDAQVNLYSHSLGGVLIAYSNIRQIRNYGTIVGSQPCIHLGIKADFIVFQPETGCTLKGIVNKVFRNHVGCLVHNTFNATIPKQCRYDQTLLDADLEPGQEILFKVVTVSAQNGVLAIKGCFFDESFDLLSETVQSEMPVTEKEDEVQNEASRDENGERESQSDDGMNNGGNEVDQSDDILNLTDGEPKKKKKKKKKKKEESDLDRDENEGEQDKDEFHYKHKKKKKKSDNEETSEDSVAQNGEDQPETKELKGQVQDDTMEDETPDEHGSRSKKKKKKKHKHSD